MAGVTGGAGDDYPDRVEIGDEVMTRIPGRRSQYRRDGRGRWELLAAVGPFVRLPDAAEEEVPRARRRRSSRRRATRRYLASG
jgi:hypothetical protein